MCYISCWSVIQHIIFHTQVRSCTPMCLKWKTPFLSQSLSCLQTRWVNILLSSYIHLTNLIKQGFCSPPQESFNLNDISGGSPDSRLQRVVLILIWHPVSSCNPQSVLEEAKEAGWKVWCSEEKSWSCPLIFHRYFRGRESVQFLCISLFYLFN